MREGAESGSGRDGADDVGRPLVGGEVLALLVLVPGVAAVARAAGGPGLLSPWGAAVMVGLWTGTIGVPTLAWLYGRGRLTWRRLTVAGGVAGLLPAGLLLLSAALGLLMRGGVDHLQSGFSRGAPVPLAGVLPWSRFEAFVAWSVAVGAGSGSIYWLLVFRRGHRRVRSWAVAALVVAGVGEVAYLLSRR